MPLFLKSCKLSILGHSKKALCKLDYKEKCFNYYKKPLYLILFSQLVGKNKIFKLTYLFRHFKLSSRNSIIRIIILSLSKMKELIVRLWFF